MSEPADPFLDNHVKSWHLWRLEQADLESRGGFPLIHGLQDLSAFALIELADSLSAPEQRALLKSLVCAHPMLQGGPGIDELSILEKKLLDRFRAVRACGGLHSQAELARRMEIGFVKRKTLKPAVIGRMEALLGPGEYRKGGVWRWVTDFPGLLTITDVDLGGNHSQLSYQHNLFLGARAIENRLLHRVSVPFLFGLGPLRWSLICPGEEGIVADMLVKYCEHFLNAVPKLFRVRGHVTG